MNNVELIRAYIANRSIPALRIYVSQLPGMQGEVALLHDTTVLAGIVEDVMTRMGHETQVKVDSGGGVRSQARKLVSRMKA